MLSNFSPDLLSSEVLNKLLLDVSHSFWRLGSPRSEYNPWHQIRIEVHNGAAWIVSFKIVRWSGANEHEAEVE
jgi:hypothetical protein